MSYLTEKTIGELLDYNFFIPSYQRGYRWSERQIEDLLEDINAFIPIQIENSIKKHGIVYNLSLLKNVTRGLKSKMIYKEHGMK